MDNWKTIGIASAVVVVAATVTVFAYAPRDGGTAVAPQSLAAMIRSANISHVPWRRDANHARVAQSCIAHGQTCVINGTPCCNSSDHCTGTFPNTYCQ